MYKKLRIGKNTYLYACGIIENIILEGKEKKYKIFPQNLTVISRKHCILAENLLLFFPLISVVTKR